MDLRKLNENYDKLYRTLKERSEFKINICQIARCISDMYISEDQDNWEDISACYLGIILPKIKEFAEEIVESKLGVFEKGLVSQQDEFNALVQLALESCLDVDLSAALAKKDLLSEDLEETA